MYELSDCNLQVNSRNKISGIYNQKVEYNTELFSFTKIILLRRKKNTKCGGLYTKVSN